MENYNIRFAKPEDAEQIASCHIASWQKIYRGFFSDEVLDTLSQEERTQKWLKWINFPVKILILESNQRIIGFVTFGPARDQDLDPKKYGEIHALYLHPEVWYLGFGKKLCEQAMTELTKMEFKEVMLWVLKENEQARKFYQRMGFTETGHTKQELDHDVVLNLLRMKKELGSCMSS